MSAPLVARRMAAALAVSVLVGGSAPVRARAQQLEPVRYLLRIPAPATHYIEVQARYPTSKQVWLLTHGIAARLGSSGDCAGVPYVSPVARHRPRKTASASCRWSRIGAAIAVDLLVIGRSLTGRPDVRRPRERSRAMTDPTVRHVTHVLERLLRAPAPNVSLHMGTP